MTTKPKEQKPTTEKSEDDIDRAVDDIPRQRPAGDGRSHPH
ncbi:hypothetical protein [Paraburkholderia terrae]|nr:hypothetical protein [Paraburkholderia terrae]